jgi:pullulanase
MKLCRFVLILIPMAAMLAVAGCGSGSSSDLSASTQPPTQPAKLAAGAITASSVSLSWTASTSSVGVAGHNVLRNGTKTGTSATASYTDTSLSADTTYSYAVSAYDAAGDTSAPSSVLSVTTLAQAPPTQPTNLTAGLVTSSAVSLSWTASISGLGVSGYNIFRNAVKVGTSTGTSYKDTGLLASTAYSYTVSAYDSFGDTSVLSSALPVTTLAATKAAPTAPTSFTAVENATYCNVILSWEASTSSIGIAGYQIMRNGSALASTPNLNYNDATPADGTSYNYAVEAYDTDGNLSAPTSAATVETGSCTPAQSFRLGAMYTLAQSTFSIWSPTSSNVQLNLNSTLYPMTLIANQNGYSDVYSVTVPGDLKLQTYNFQVGGVTARDPYGVMVEPGTNNDIVMDPSLTTLTSGWTPRPTLTNRVDSIVYEAHVREFTNDSSSGVPAADRGYFEGMTDAGTTVNGVAGAPSTGISHLADMGVTHIQIMPFFDFNDCINTTADSTCFNWGYDPLNYNIPTADYSQTPTDYTNRVLEVKRMIDNFHQQGIRVIMDVVYNHTSSEAVFGGISSDYYLTTDITGCGNTIDGSNPMVARMIQDSLEYWVTQYNVDGFRFDLLGVFPLRTVNQWGTYLTTMYPERNLLLYGEPWVDGTPATTAFNLGNVGTIASSHFGAFNGGYRGALKGTNDNAGGNTGFLFSQSTNDSFYGAYVPGQTWPGTGDAGYGPISLGVAGSPVPSLPATANSDEWEAAFAAAPEQSINYVSVHDNLNLHDKVTAWQSSNGKIGQSLTDSLIAYGFGMILTSQGIPFMYEGDEFQHTKDDNGNSYNMEYDLLWSSLQSNTDVAATYATVKALIALRKAHPSLRFSTWSEINTHVQSNQLSASLVVTTINASATANESWNKSLIIYNSSTSAQSVTLPSGSWNLAVANSNVETGTAPVVSGTVSAGPIAVTVLYQ